MNRYATSSTIYVSAENGDDSYSGLSPVATRQGDGPVKTLAQAMSMIGQFRYDGILQPYTVKLMDSIVYLSETLRVSSRVDARYCEKTPSFFTLEPYGEEPVTIVGGERIEGWKHDTFMGVACFSAAVPAVKDGWRFTDLYVDGDRAESTRYPAEGFLTPEDVENHGTHLMSSSNWFIAKEGDIPEGADLSNAVISFGHYWIDEHSAISAYDPETRRVTLAAATRFTVSPEAGASARMDYYIENLPNNFKNPGEWYLDTKEGKLYYIPKNESQTPESIVVYAPKVSVLIDIIGKEDDIADSICFRNLRFTCTKGEYESIGFPRTHGGDDAEAGGSGKGMFTPGKAYASDLQACSDMHGAIKMTYAENCRFENCDIFAVGNHGIYMDDGCVGNRVERCHLYCLGAGAIRISGGLVGEAASSESHGNIITNCHIEDGGRRHFAACGVAIIHAHHNEVSHCDIHDFFYSGISCGFVWGYHKSNSHHNRFVRNHIYNLGKGRLSDMGGIYMLGPQKGSLIEGNIIHDVKCKVYGGWAMYTDEGSSYITIENNICYNCSSNCYHQHYGQLNVIRNNVFAASGEALLVMGRREARLGLIIESNIFCSTGSAAFSNCTPAMFSSDRNLFWSTGEKPLYMSAKEGDVLFEDRVAKFAADEHSVYADPLFLNPEEGNFTLSPSSPAFALGFKPIDTSDIGCDL